MKLGFVLLSAPEQPIPSTRVAVLNVLPHLRAAGWGAEIVYAASPPTETPQLPEDLPERLQAQGFDAIVFQKVRGPSVLAAAARLRQLGVRTAFLVCDLVDEAMAEATDITLTVTDFLASLYPAHLRSRIHVMHDGIERPDVQRSLPVRQHRGSAANPLNAVLVTSSALTTLPVIGLPPHWLNVTIVGRYPARADRRGWFNHVRWTLAQLPGWPARMAFVRFLGCRRIRCVDWHPERVYDELARADIGIIPIDGRGDDPGPLPGVPWWRVKSENRLTLKMAVGLPVVATPIPAYEVVVDPANNAFLASSAEDWAAALEALRDPDTRLRVGNAARTTVLTHYSVEAQARRMMAALRHLDVNTHVRP